MTTLDELCSVIDSIGLPWANTAFEREEKAEVFPPYIVLTRQTGQTFGADDATWCAVAEYDIELYTERRDYGLERTVTDALDNAGIYFSDGGVWPIPSEGLIEAVVTVTVREN